jgi:hypothetical protein
MNWFRSNIKYGLRLVLFALAVQFVMSFGHFRGSVAQAALSIQSGATQAKPAPADPVAAPSGEHQSVQRQRPKSDRDCDQRPERRLRDLRRSCAGEQRFLCDSTIAAAAASRQVSLRNHRRRVRSSELRTCGFSASHSPGFLTSMAS